MLLSKFKTFLIILLLIVLTLNHLKILNYVNEKYSCNDQIELKENKRDKLLKVQFPHVFDILPHLKHAKKHYFKPKFILTKYRTNNTIVIGIATMKRQNATYLDKTLGSLFEAMTIDDKSKTLVVLQITEVSVTILMIIQYFRINFFFCRKMIKTGLLIQLMV
jgi:glycosylphosphatidylinositol transamidase (GPIT) subunit GPI8